MGRHGHDRAGSVRCQHVICDPDRDPFAVDRIDGIGADRHARLLALGRHALDIRFPPRALDVRLDLDSAFRRGQPLDQRVLGRQHHVGHAEHRVDTCREDRDLQLRVSVDGQVELDTL